MLMRMTPVIACRTARRCNRVRMMMRIDLKEKSTDEIYGEPEARDADCLVKVNCEGDKHAMKRFAGHQQCDYRQHDCAGEPAKHAYFPGPKTKLLIGCEPPSEVVGDGRDEKGDYMCAHVPAISQQRHRMREDAGGDFDHHHHASDGDHDPRPPFGLGKVRHKIVRLPKPGMIGPMHQRKLPLEIRKVIPTKAAITNRKPDATFAS